MGGNSLGAPPGGMNGAKGVRITLGCKERLHLLHGRPHGKDDRLVARRKHVPARGYEHGPVPEDGAYDGVLGEVDLGELAVGESGVLRYAHVDDLGPALEQGYRRDLAPPDEPEDRA